LRLGSTVDVPLSTPWRAFRHIDDFKLSLAYKIGDVDVPGAQRAAAGLTSRLRRVGEFMASHARVPWVAMWVVWLVSRADLYRAATVTNMNGDVGVYQHWYSCCLSRGAFPVADQMWQYPPGAALVFWLPGRLPGGYVSNFALLAIGCDLAVTLMLCARARRGGSAAGAWCWVCGVPLLGAIAVTRFDVVPVAVSVAAVCLAGRGVARGALTGAGAAIKIWPVTLLAGTPPGKWRRDLAAAVVVLALVCGVFARATVSFLAHQAARGVEVESVVATPLMIWREAGWGGTVVFRFGAMQLSGWPVALARDTSTAFLVLAVVAVLGWRLLIATGRLRWRPEFATDAPLAATLLFLVTSPVLSPQYLLWVIGLAAACLATGRTAQRPVALAVLATAGLTQLVFPAWWPELISGSAAVTVLLVARNTLLVATTVLSCRRILRASRPGREEPPAGREERVTASATRPGAA
jgi:Glycosyltransferase family 87